jgi:glutathione S-transferase
MAIILHGPAYSTYARTARLVLEEKGAAYELREVDILKGEGQQPAHLARQPFGKVPALEYDGFALFETFAIARYLDEVLPGPRLQPEDAKRRARMTQICGVLDSYGYGAMVGKVFWQAAIVPMQGGTPDQAVLAEGVAMADRVLDVLEGLAAEGGEFLCGGGQVSLADLFLVPVVEYFAMTEPGRAALAAHPRIGGWWQRMAQRPSVVKTRPQLG